MTPPLPMPEFTAQPSAVGDFAAELLTASAIADDLGTFAAGASDSGLAGAADAAYQRGRRILAYRGDACSLALRSAAREVFAHAATLERLGRHHAELVGRHAELSRLVDAVSAEAVGGAGRTPVATVEAMLAEYERDRGRWLVRLSVSENAVLVAFERVAGLEEALRRYGGQVDPADTARRTMPPPGAGPEAVALWWRGLTHGQQEAIIAADPELVGDLDGVPAWARDRANTVRLDRDLQEIEAIAPGARTTEQQQRLDNALAAEQARSQLRSAADPVTGAPYSSQTYVYDPDAFGGDGAIAIAVGDLDSARNVAITVPGFGTDAGSAPAQSHKAIDVEQAADFVGAGGAATMFWIGYDAPDNTPWGEGGTDAAGVLTDQMAADGGRRLAATVEGVTAMRSSDPHLTVIGHSYGSTAAALGASFTPHGQIDDLVLAGSPGAGQAIHDAADTGLADGHVWVGRNSADPIAALGNHGAINLQVVGAGLGTDPAADGFGATRFEAESTARGDGTDIADHQRYFDHGTESLANIAHIVDGQDAAVTQAPPVCDPLLPDPQHHVGDLLHHTEGMAADMVDALHHPRHLGSDALDALLHGRLDLDALVGGPEDPEALRVPTAPATGGP